MTRRGRGLFSVLAAIVALLLLVPRAVGNAIYQQDSPSTDGEATHNARRVGLVGMQPPGLGHAQGIAPIQGEERASLNGTPTISDTYNPRDQGTDWPADAFTGLVVGHQSPEPISRPALHSYAGDGNMEAVSVFGPFSRQEDRYDLGAYTGAVGPAGGSTPENHPEITAP